MQWSNSLQLSVPLGSDSAAQSHLTQGHTFSWWCASGDWMRLTSHLEPMQDTAGLSSLQSFLPGGLKLCQTCISIHSSLCSTMCLHSFCRGWSLINTHIPNSISVCLQGTHPVTVRFMAQVTRTSQHPSSIVPELGLSLPPSSGEELGLEQS